MGSRQVVVGSRQVVVGSRQVVVGSRQVVEGRVVVVGPAASLLVRRKAEEPAALGNLYTLKIIMSYLANWFTMIGRWHKETQNM